MKILNLNLALLSAKMNRKVNLQINSINISKIATIFDVVLLFSK